MKTQNNIPHILNTKEFLFTNFMVALKLVNENLAEYLENEE
mgnify:CR=1 FL=1